MLPPDPSALMELQKVFNPEMAYATYVPFSCLLGRVQQQEQQPLFCCFLILTPPVVQTVQERVGLGWGVRNPKYLDHRW